MTLYFCNEGEIDLDAALLLGLSAKVNGNPLGKFGSGAKMAVAILLRTGHSVTVYQGLKKNTFSTRAGTSRGTEFFQVYCGNKALGFTTHLGSHWEVWQALRELKSNAQDEGGYTTDKKVAPAPGTTVIAVDGPAIMEAWEQRSKYFLEPDSAIGGAGPKIKVHAGSGIYCRGILVHDIPTAFAYNIDSVELTEDRTLKSEWSVCYDIISWILLSPDSSYLGEILENKCREWDMPWYTGMSVSPENHEILRVYLKLDGIKAPNIKTFAQALIPAEFEVREPIEAERELINAGYAALEPLGLIRPDIWVSPSLAGGAYRAFQGSVPYLSPEIFDLGQRAVSGALLEVCLLASGKKEHEVQEFILDSLIRNLEAKIGLDTAELSNYQIVADQIEKQLDLTDEIIF